MNPYNGHSGAKRTRVARMVYGAFNRGELERPSRCIACGQTDGTIHAHNEDYDRPFDFVGLCITCHLMLHCRFRSRARWEEYRRRVRDGWQAPALTQRTGMIVLQRTILRGEWPDGVWDESRRRESTWLDQLTYEQPPVRD